MIIMKESSVIIFNVYDYCMFFYFLIYQLLLHKKILIKVDNLILQSDKRILKLIKNEQV